MNARKLLVFIAVLAVAVALIKQLAEKSQSTEGDAAKSAAEPEASPIVSVVAETLHKHEGEDNPIVHAFEEALEHEARHEG